ncbi:right-handed parallel beta-helix repeat-containing protein [Gaoshiqia sp. Z1-71]|uniref:right-handed parallel beta-helix repeat-containing protein n=1 Tax=Gaoshiqia hydrogeniformans TaxID=3290090 RepID=UPI003BF8F60C
MIKSTLISVMLFACFMFSVMCSSATANGQSGSAPDTVRLARFGVKANSFENAASGIVKAIGFCKSKKNVVLSLPGGRIDVWPEGAFKKELYISNSTENDTLSKVKNIAFLLEGIKDMTIDGNGTLVMLHGKMESFVFLNCTDVVLKNISFDYERPTMSELKIRSATNNEAIAEIHPDTRFDIKNGKIRFYGEGWKSNAYHTISCDPATGVMKYSSFRPFLESQATQTGCREVTFKGDFSKLELRTGNVLTIRDPYRDNSGALISLSKNICLENVKMHYMHGLGIVSQFSENISLLKVEVAPRPESGRQISAFADCFHFSGCKGKILIDSCFTSGSHDDPINVHGTHLQITAIDAAKKITVRFMHHQTYGFEAFFAGDSIAFINPQTLMPVATAQLRSAKLINLREMELELDGPLPENVKTGLCIENLTWTPEVIIRNSRFERTNTRGLLITTRRKVLIENNTFFRTGMFPILIADDASSWFESGAVTDVTIRNNIFEDCGYNSGSGAINIAPENHELVVGNSVHRNIRIINNTFKVFDGAVLSARSVENLEFTGNRIIRSHFLETENKSAAISLTACKKVRIEKNNFDQAELPVIDAVKMTKKDLKSDLKINLNK